MNDQRLNYEDDNDKTMKTRDGLSFMSVQLSQRNMRETDAFMELISLYQQLMRQLAYMTAQNQQLHQFKQEQLQQQQHHKMDATNATASHLNVLLNAKDEQLQSLQKYIYDMEKHEKEMAKEMHFVR